MNGMIYGYKTTEPASYGTIILDSGPPLTWWEKAIRASLVSLGFAAVGTLIVIAAMANPELFGGVFGASFAVAVLSMKR